jgi:uncharacterized membrane protein
MSKELPKVYYKMLPKSEYWGRECFLITKSEHPLWLEKDTFSDDDMSMGSTQVHFILDETA